MGVNGDLMGARRKLRSDGPAPPQSNTCISPARARRPDDPSTCVIEEVFDDESTVQKSAGTKPAPGYTRVLIEEDSDTDCEDEQDAPSGKVFDDESTVQKNAGAKPAPGYTRVLIEEDRDSDTEDEQDAPSGKVVGGSHKVQIQEDSDESEAGEPPIVESVQFDYMD